MRKKKSPYEKGYPTRSKDVFVTQAMLYAVRDELKSDMARLEHTLKSDMARLEHTLNAGLARMDAQIHRLATLIEEQNARNIAVMDGLTVLFDRQDRVEKRMDAVEKTIESFRR